MSMKQPQWVVFGLGVLLVGILYFGFSIRPPEAAEKDRERSLQAVQTSADVLLKEKMATLDASGKQEFRALQSELQAAEGKTDSVEVLKQLSGAWYRLGELALAGHYAEEVAEKEKTAEAWSIAGTTFAAGLSREDMTEKERTFIAQNARQAFENAISMEPSNLDHRVNLAVTYVQNPPEDEPMKGISILLELSKEHPDNPAVLFQLGRFGIQTGQYEKAVSRLEKVVSLEPNRREAYCLLVTAYREIGNTAKALEAEEKCKKQN